MTSGDLDNRSMSTKFNEVLAHPNVNLDSIYEILKPCYQNAGL